MLFSSFSSFIRSARISCGLSIEEMHREFPEIPRDLLERYEQSACEIPREQVVMLLSFFEKRLRDEALRRKGRYAKPSR